MWNEPSKERLSAIPKLYATEHIPIKDKRIHLHFFLGSCDWFIAEYDGNDIFWGYTILNGDHECAEWGYISFSELKSIKAGKWCEVDCVLEKYWRPKKVSEIPVIKT